MAGHEVKYIEDKTSSNHVLLTRGYQYSLGCRPPSAGSSRVVLTWQCWLCCVDWCGLDYSGSYPGVVMVQTLWPITAPPPVRWPALTACLPPLATLLVSQGLPGKYSSALESVVGLDIEYHPERRETSEDIGPAWGHSQCQRDKRGESQNHHTCKKIWYVIQSTKITQLVMFSGFLSDLLRKLCFYFLLEENYQYLVWMICSHIAPLRAGLENIGIKDPFVQVNGSYLKFASYQNGLNAEYRLYW